MFYNVMISVLLAIMVIYFYVSYNRHQECVSKGGTYYLRDMLCVKEEIKLKYF